MKNNRKITGMGYRGIVKPYLGSVVLLSILAIFQSVIQVALALLMRMVIDAAISGSPDLGKWIALLVADLILQLTIHTFESWYSSTKTATFIAACRASLLKSAVYSADSKLDGFHSGQLLSRGMEDVNTICDGVLHALPSLVGQIARLIAAFCAVWVVYPGIAIVLLIAAVVVLVVVAILRPVLKVRHRSVRRAEEQVMSAMQEDLQQLELIQSLSVHKEILHRFIQKQKVSLREKLKRRILTVSTHALMNTVSLLGTGVLLIWGAGKVAAGMLSYGSLTSLLQLLSQFRSPVLGLSGLWGRFTAVEVAEERLEVLLDIPEQPPAYENLPVPTAVVFENVTFSYPGEDVPVLKNFNLRFPLGSWSCITGVSGRGKTTLFKLMLGLYLPQEGRVFLQTEQGDIPCSSQTRHLFAYVPQDYALFSGTVLENLLLVDPQADEQKRQQALKLAAADFVYEMTQGENAHLRENNTGLSKGQIQRLAIARAVLMERPVLLLDECTSALDAETEKKVLENLYGLVKNAIVVTHRPEALKELDGITAVSMEQ